MSGPGPLVLISDAARVGEARFLDVLCAALEAGLPAVQIREPSWGLDEVSTLVERVLDLVGASGRPDVVLLVSRRAELVERFGLAGVHVGGGRPEAVAAARAIAPRGALVGYSAHSIPEIEEAARHGADYASYSPVFGAISKRHALEPVGLEGLRLACRAATIPVLALGGILPEHAPRIREAGAAGAATIGGILDAEDPGAAVREFLAGWNRDERSAFGGQPSASGPAIAP